MPRRRKSFRRRADPGSLDGLEDDVAVLTYEHALKAHARYRREETPLGSEPSADFVADALNLREELAASAAQLSIAVPGAESSSKSRKSASITVRLTAAEDGQLRVRAAEAGLTISAYLRSCAFEVESLRAQVKQVVAQMREGEQQRPASRRSWVRRFFRRLLGRG